MTKDVGLRLHQVFRGNWRAKGGSTLHSSPEHVVPMSTDPASDPCWEHPWAEAQAEIRPEGSGSEPGLVPAQHSLA